MAALYIAFVIAACFAVPALLEPYLTDADDTTEDPS